MNRWILIMLFCVSASLNASETCQKALDDNQDALDLYGPNTLTASTGWRAYQTCKQDLDSEGQALATLVEGRCTRSNSQVGSMYRSFAAQCSLEGVLFLKQQSR